MKLILLLLTIFIAFSVSAQSWQWGARGGGGSNGGGSIAETVVDMTSDNAGNVYVLSSVNGGVPITLSGTSNAMTTYGFKEILLSSYSCNGTFRWKKLIGGGSDDVAVAIGVDTLGHVYMTGNVGRISPPLPPVRFDNDTLFSISNPKTFFVLQYDTTGNFKWLHQPTSDTMNNSGQFSSRPRDMIVNANGDVEILCHLSPGLLSGSNIVVDTPSAYILKYDINGNITALVKPDLNWRQVAGDGQNPTALGNLRMAKTKSGKYIIGGRLSYNPLSIGAPLIMGGHEITKNMFAGFFDQDWQLLWRKENSSNASGAIAHRPMVAIDGNIVLAGGTSKSDQFAGYTVTNTLSQFDQGLPTIYKLDTFGNLIFARNLEANTTCSSVGGITDNKIYLAGAFPGRIQLDGFAAENPPNTGRDIYLVIFDLAAGAVLGLDTLKGPAGHSDDLRVSVADKYNNIYLGGELGSSLQVGSSTLQSAGGNSDFFIAKYGTSNCIGTIVPVRLTAFTATLQNSDVLTRWQTAQEQNTKAFIVERSTNAVAFTPIGTVPAKGNSNAIQTYSFTDSTPFSVNSQLTTLNSLFYRLKILDLDGSYTYSSIAKINLTAVKGISIYPNPVRSTAVVSYKLANGSANGVLEVYSMIGHKISSTTLPAYTGTQTLNTAALPGGIYNVVLRSNGKVVGSEKLVVEK